MAGVAKGVSTPNPLLIFVRGGKRRSTARQVVKKEIALKWGRESTPNMVVIVVGGENEVLCVFDADGRTARLFVFWRSVSAEKTVL